MKELLAHSLPFSWRVYVFVSIACLTVILPTIASAQEAERAELARVSLSSSGISFQPVQEAEGWVLTVSGPEGFHSRQEFWGESPSFSPSSAGASRLPDGSYTWELRPSYVLDRGTRERLQALREGGDASALATLQAELRKSGKLPSGLDAQSGHFRVASGSVVTSGATEQGSERASTRDQVILDDLIVDGSICVGFDCVNGESFGFDTLRLKENNLRIKFQDTSNSASFPTNDWQLTANDSSNGGANKFSIDDIDGGRTPFTIEAGAPSHSLYVEDSGQIGFGTSTPVVEMHSRDGDTPTLRLEQDGSSGFTPQTWDVAGNETNFFIRDVTNGSRLPFRIRPGAPTSSIDISPQGRVGIGTTSPTTQLHVRGSSDAAGGGNTVRVEIENDSDSMGHRDLLTLRNMGGSRILFVDEDSGANWFVTNQTDVFMISKGGSGVTEFRLGSTGNLQIAGTLSENSSRRYKTEITPINVREILNKASDLPLFEWSYEKDVAARHMGPMAEDFGTTFGLGHDEQALAPRDVAAVALGAIQGLYDLFKESEVSATEYQDRLQLVEQERKDLLERLSALERAVQELLIAVEREQGRR